jgi:protein-L-isoaspartate(D-aspartate) O-methyltransferase
MKESSQNNHRLGHDKYFHQRKQMVQTQIVSRGVKDQRVIQAFLKIPRHLFVGEELVNQAYDDNPLPIGLGQTISQPYMVAYMLEHLKIESHHKVLEIGTGSGYQTALLCELSKEVYTVERLSQLSLEAKERLTRLGYSSIRYKREDGTLGWDEFAPYERIIISASSPQTPPTLIKQLSDDNGILLCPEGNEYFQEVVRTIKSHGRIQKDNLGSCVFVKLLGKEGWEQ